MHQPKKNLIGMFARTSETFAEGVKAAAGVALGELVVREPSGESVADADGEVSGDAPVDGVSEVVVAETRLGEGDGVGIGQSQSASTLAKAASVCRSSSLGQGVGGHILKSMTARMAARIT